MASLKKKLWQTDATEEDMKCASQFLSLLYTESEMKRLVSGLRRARSRQGTAKDLLRASNLPLLPSSDAHVEKDLKKIRKKKPLSPVLLIRGDMGRGIPLLIADGYHRICAVCHFDEDAAISYRISTLQATARASSTPAP